MPLSVPNLSPHWSPLTPTPSPLLYSPLTHQAFDDPYYPFTLYISFPKLIDMPDQSEGAAAQNQHVYKKPNRLEGTNPRNIVDVGSETDALDKAEPAFVKFLSKLEMDNAFYVARWYTVGVTSTTELSWLLDMIEDDHDNIRNEFINCGFTPFEFMQIVQVLKDHMKITPT